MELCPATSPAAPGRGRRNRARCAWEHVRGPALAAELRACWSTVARRTAGRSTVALYFGGSPLKRDFELMSRLPHGRDRAQARSEEARAAAGPVPRPVRERRRGRVPFGASLTVRVRESRAGGHARLRQGTAARHQVDAEIYAHAEREQIVAALHREAWRDAECQMRRRTVR
jgi:hypothetical protein